LLNLRGEKKEWVKHGWRSNGIWERDGGGKGRGSASTPCEVPSYFPAIVAPFVESVLRVHDSKGIWPSKTCALCSGICGVRSKKV